MSESRITLGKVATSVVRHVGGRIVDDGLKSLPSFRDFMGRLDAANAADASTVALVLMLAGCEALGIDTAEISGVKIAPKDVSGSDGGDAASSGEDPKPE